MSGAGCNDLRDAGFFDICGARASVRRQVLKHGLRNVQTSVAALLDVLDKPGKSLGNDRPALLQGMIGLIGGGEERRLNNISVEPIDRDDVREKELLQGVDLILQLLDSLSVALGHGLFSVAVAGEASDSEEAAHRLSETVK